MYNQVVRLLGALESGGQIELMEQYCFLTKSLDFFYFGKNEKPGTCGCRPRATHGGTYDLLGGPKFVSVRVSSNLRPTLYRAFPVVYFSQKRIASLCLAFCYSPSGIWVVQHCLVEEDRAGLQLQSFFNPALARADLPPSGISLVVIQRNARANQTKLFFNLRRRSIQRVCTYVEHMYKHATFLP